MLQRITKKSCKMRFDAFGVVVRVGIVEVDFFSGCGFTAYKYFCLNPAPLLKVDLRRLQELFFSNLGKGRVLTLLGLLFCASHRPFIKLPR